MDRHPSPERIAFPGIARNVAAAHQWLVRRSTERKQQEANRVDQLDMLRELHAKGYNKVLLGNSDWQEKDFFKYRIAKEMAVFDKENRAVTSLSIPETAYGTDQPQQCPMRRLDFADLASYRAYTAEAEITFQTSVHIVPLMLSLER